jgi:hypothetical protein
MRQPLAIVQIFRRSEQGATRPFLCRCEDDRHYYVKGRSAGPRSMLCEWLAGHMARALDLPVPDFAVVRAPPELIFAHAEGNELGPLPAFASHVANSWQELSASHLDEVDDALKRDVAVFDWWVRNQDRTLTTQSGNPNLLWNGSEKQLAVIDHNLAFDRDFDAKTFHDTHVFADALAQVRGDESLQDGLAQRLRTALKIAEQVCDEAPPEWWFADEERTIAVDFDRTAVMSILRRCDSAEFWRFDT